MILFRSRIAVVNIGRVFHPTTTITTTTLSSMSTKVAQQSDTLMKPTSTWVMPQLKVGDQLHGYKVTRVKPVEELSAIAIELHHEASGAKHYHVARDDENNVFSCILRTTPHDDTGMPHVLEHLVLCGSKEFPCRDPFMKMTSRSLCTDMNASTWPDATMYYFSSTNRRDVSNLMDVYLDSVFFPNMRHMDFLQEGWRLEHKEVKDPTSDVVIKGVVFNEMKGAFSTQSDIFLRSLINELFPATIYQHESGGDPLVIPSLTHEETMAFYRQHYHPTNARFFTYGSFPVEDHLEKIHNRVLSKFPKNEQYRQVSQVQMQDPWTEPRKKVIECAPDSLAPCPEKQTTASVSFLMEDVLKTPDCFVLDILSRLLTNGPNSPFYQALISKGLGSDYSPGTGFSTYTRQSIFSVGCVQMKESDAEKLEEVVRQTFEQVVKDGFPAERIEAEIHLIEIGLKHVTSNTGMKIMKTMNPIINHDGDVLEALRTVDEINYLRKSLEQDPDFLKTKVKEYFLNNRHQLFLQMNPSSEYMKNKQEKEKAVIQEKLSRMNEQDREKIFTTGTELAGFQAAKEDLSSLPTLDVSKDITRERKFYPIEDLKVKNIPVQCCPGKTNGVTYFKAYFGLDHLPPRLRPYLPLYTSIVTRIGAGSRTYKEMDQEITMRTKGLSADLHNSLQPNSLKEYDRGLVFSSFCLEKNTEAMLNLWKDILTAPNFTEDLDHISQLVRMMASDMSDGVADSGNTYAAMIAGQNLTPTAKFREQVGGLTFMKFLKETVEADEVQVVIKNLQEIHGIICTRSSLKLAINLEEKEVQPTLKLLESVVEGLPEKSDHSGQDGHDSASSKDEVREHHFLNLNNNYVAKALTAVPFAHEDNAALTVAGPLLTMKYLLREVREIGGAYGVRASNGDGVFTFTSYRDPHTANTLKKYQDAAAWLLAGSFTDEEINEAKLSVFQSVDHPITPKMKGGTQFLRKISQEEWHQYRLRLLDVSRSDLIRVAGKYLMNQSGPGTGSAIIGPETKEVSENWTPVRHAFAVEADSEDGDESDHKDK